MEKIGLGLYSIPSGAAYSTISVSARYKTNYPSFSFAAVDSFMAEYSKFPTAYHQEADPLRMTVEFESSEENKFVDKRMNLSPIVNQDPNGFLYITDMPATLWGGPENLEVTTLHEYRWPEGRLFSLPWARMFGKDKLTQKAIFSATPTKPVDIIQPFNYPKRPKGANLVPSTLVAAQGNKVAHGFYIEVFDEDGNPYSLRNYTLSIFEEKENFPGWISKSYYGAKEQLGSTTYGSLNEHGAAIASYFPPGPETIRVSTEVPTPLNTGSSVLGEDTISSIVTPYTISEENNGNVTIFGDNGKFFKLEGNPISGDVKVDYDKNVGPYINTQYPPTFGTVSIHLNS